jgi:3-keto-disaccharide hydrolase
MRRIFSYCVAIIVVLSLTCPTGFSQAKKPSNSNLPLVAPGYATKLFTGESLDNWTLRDGKPAAWKLNKGFMTSAKGSIMTKEVFGDCYTHVEFRIPKEPATNKASYWGNSGVYMQGRYEVQVLESYGKQPQYQQCGAIYKIATPEFNMSLPTEQWQSFDIHFRAPRFDKKKQVSQFPRMTVYHNGVKIIENVEIKKTHTGSGLADSFIPAAPLMLQDHGHPVDFRNIWVIPKDYQWIERLKTAGFEKVPPRKDRPSNKKLPVVAPAKAIKLFDGKSLDEFVYTSDKKKDTPVAWKLKDNYAEVVRGGSIKTKKEFGDGRLHVEFWLPTMPLHYGQGRANSGVYLQGRYEVQVLNSFGLEPQTNHCGGIYKVAKPRVNASMPPEQWQSYDITFRAARLNADGSVKQYPRATVVHNGVKIIEDVEIKKDQTGGGYGGFVEKGPLMLQEHGGDPVRYRNIWFVPGK